MLELKLASQDLLNLIKKGIDEIKNNPSEFDTFDVKRFMAVPENDLKAYFNELEKERKGIDLKERFVPQSVFWLFEKKLFIGFLVIRHNLTDQMIKNGVGHIGYEIIPSQRRKGYAKKGVQLLLDYAKNILHLNEVIICCLENNIPSYKTMLSLVKKYGGYEMATVQVNDKRKKRCLIKL